MDRVGHFPFLSRVSEPNGAKTLFGVRLARESEVAEHIRPISRDDVNQCFVEYSCEYGYLHPSPSLNQTCGNRYFGGYL
jgi:hypothetical protein